MSGAGPDRDAFLEAAAVPLDGHVSGTLDQAEAILAAHPELTTDIFVAATLGDPVGVRRALALNPAARATAKGGPRGWDPLTWLCFSRYLRLDRSRWDGFVAAAQVLLDAGADANSGWFDTAHQPRPVRESVLYGAAGIAHHPRLTRLLLDHGANPNDEETPYHAPEGRDNAALEVLVRSGKLTPDSLATMLLRKADWHDLEGVRLLLAHGADPNRVTRWGRTGLQQAILRDNPRAIVEAMLDHGADPAVTLHGRSAGALAAHRGRSDVLALLEQRGAGSLTDEDQLIAACARGDGDVVRQFARANPDHVRLILRDGSRLLAEFAGNGNTAGVGLLLELGVPVTTRFASGDGYWEVAPDSTALHVAAWRAQHDTVRFLVARGAPVNAVDGRGRTPLALAVRACVDSYWTDRRSPESVRVLLEAGASPGGVPGPTGYRPVDDLISGSRR